MSQLYARDFSEISRALVLNEALRDLALELIENQPIAGKVTEGGTRLKDFREILKPLIKNEISLTEAYLLTQRALAPMTSAHAGNKKVFTSDWAERLVRIQYSRFYNQAVLEQIISKGHSKCFVEHSSTENVTSNCSKNLVGKIHDAHILHKRLVDAYARGDWNNEPKIPDHFYCSHVVSPAD
jgi:hypothetical protein